MSYPGQLKEEFWLSVICNGFFILLFLGATFLLSGCGKDSPIKRTEYLINGEWLQCSLIESNPCGETLRCGDRVFQCQINLEMRLR